MENYTIEKVIGEGSYGKALLCKEKATDEFVVIKQISFTNLTEQEREDSRKETQILSYLHHPNIIGYRGSFLERNIFHIVMDYADDGDLGEKISAAQDYFKEDQILHWFVQICLALKHIHDRKILHRDLKTQNVFMMKNDVVKLGDFGISKVLDHTTSFAKTSIGTPYYLSPEICEGKPYNAKSDIWSLGCVLYEMCTKKHPFDSNCINGLIVKIIRCKPTPIPKQYSSNLRSIIDLMLQKNASKRPTINQILKIPFIKDKIGQLLTQTMAKIEFCHTVFHGVKGGETPDVILVPDKIEADPATNEKPKAKSRLAVRKSRIPTSQRSIRASVSRQKKIVTKEEIVQQKKAIVSAERQQVKADREKKQAEDKKQQETQQSKRHHFLEEQKQKKREKELQMAQLRKEERERQKHYESLEAPFKKLRQHSSGKTSPNASGSNTASPSASQEEINPPKQADSSPTKSSTSANEEKKSQEKSESAENDNNGDDLFEDDFITFEEEDEAQKDVDDLLSLAAVASDMKDNPPSEDDDNEEREEERKSNEAPTKFIFRGKELPISEKDPRSVRNEAVRAFIEKNLGAEKFLSSYRLITEESSSLNEDEFEKKLGTILTSKQEMDFCPLIQQLVVSELFED